MIGGMAVLALGGFLASLATVWMAQELSQGVALSIVAFMLIGFGVSACGTSLLSSCPSACLRRDAPQQPPRFG
jgi:BCD family chlorophyll transporter-like MFS transporter